MEDLKAYLDNLLLKDYFISDYNKHHLILKDNKTKKGLFITCKYNTSFYFDKTTKDFYLNNHNQVIEYLKSNNVFKSKLNLFIARQKKEQYNEDKKVLNKYLKLLFLSSDKQLIAKGNYLGFIFHYNGKIVNNIKCSLFIKTINNKQYIVIIDDYDYEYEFKFDDFKTLKNVNKYITMINE